jgi:tRNA(Ile)-lysidine synthase
VRQQEQWELRVMEQARADGWWHSGGAVVVAVSGGPDSMALLHLLIVMSKIEPFRIVIAHVNHQFRGAESDAEAEMVRRAAAEWGVPFETAALDLPSYIADTGMNTQSAAREKRYQFLKEVAHRHACSILLLGHHAGDQAETLIMRMIRGTGPSGLAGIPMRRKEEQLELIRPLLRITKCELLEYCKRNEVPYAVDSSNVDRHYFRNAVRLDLIPLLEKYNPKLQASLVRLADMAAADDDYMEAETLKVFKAGVTPSGEGFRIERRGFRGLHVALQRRLIKLILNCSSNPRQIVDFQHIDEMVAAVTGERPTVIRLDIGDGWVLKREYEEVYIGPSVPALPSFAYIVDETMEEVAIAETGGYFILERLGGRVHSMPANQLEACFDEGELYYPLQIRSRLPGDVLHPHGLNGTKKVQDMFVDAKVPRSYRDRQLLLVDGEGRVLWIPGMRRSRHALVTGHTSTTLRITFEAGTRA